MEKPFAHPRTEALTPSGSAPLKLKFVVVSGPDAGCELVLEAGTYTVGKAPESDLVLNDPAVSRTHLVVAVQQESVRVTDNGSTNGSFCEEMRFEVLEVKPGASVRVGRSVLKLVPQRTPASALRASSRTQFGALAGNGLRMRELFALLEKIAQADADVLVQGETGTGKELCAEAIHAQGARKSGPFVVCDLAAAAPSLIESELFGHRKGAFTGATSDRVGPFEQAHGGTLLLDEIGDLPLELQPRLLRVLERRQVKRVGAEEYRTVDVRVISATHRDLEAEVEAGRFRRDLFHRLAVTRVRLPPLRERPEDIPFLIDVFLSRLGKPATEVDPQTRAILCNYAWPGNVRELRHVVERVVALGSDQALGDTAPEGASSPAGRLVPADAGVPFKEAKQQMVDAFERDYLAQLLQRCGWNLSRASREAGVARFYLRQLIRKHGLEAP